METCYVYRKELSHEELLHIYETKLHANPKFSHEFEANHISIAQGFYIPYLMQVLKIYNI